MRPLALACALGSVLLAADGPLPDFRVSAMDGANVAFSSLRGGPVTVVGFVSAKCPVSDIYHRRMIALYREYTPKGVHFVFLNSNSNETADDLRKEAQSASLPFPVYKDWDNRAADLFGAQTTPEFFVLDDRNAIRYRGALDDSQNEARVRVKGLDQALKAVLIGRPVSFLRRPP